MRKNISTLLVAFLLVSVLTACGSNSLTNQPVLQNNIINNQPNVSAQNSEFDYHDISINEMNKILVGTNSYLNSRNIWEDISQMPPDMQFYFKRIGNKYKVSGTLQVKASGFLFKSYSLSIEDTNKKEKSHLISKEFLSRKNAENWLKTLPQNKNVIIYFSVKKVNYREISSEPFVLDKIE